MFPIRRDRKGRLLSFITGCHECGLLFVNPVPTEEHLQQFYSDSGPWAAARSAQTSTVAAAHARGLRGKPPQPKPGKPLPAREVLLNALAPYVPIHEPPAGARVLDFGCGEGQFLNSLQDRGWDTYGIEPSTSVAFLRHHRLTSLPDDGTFDFVILHHVLEHVTDPLGLLRQLAASLREGGSLFVSVPRLDTLPEHADFNYCINGRHHPVPFTEACLRGLLARASLELVTQLNTKELDEAVSDGKPLRLRLLATRQAVPSVPVSTPLAPALRALAQYAHAHDGLAARVQKLIPLRMRAALMVRARVRNWRRRR